VTNYLPFIFLCSLFWSCKPNEQLLENYESKALKVERITDRAYQHTSYLHTRSLGIVPCNGMIFINGNEAIVFDTPTNDQASAELINWIGDRKIKAVVATHFHIDCLGGLGEFHENEIASYATNHTIRLVVTNDEEVVPKTGFNDQYQFQIGKEVVLAKHFGQGHTKDNIVGFIPSEKVLFGGCLIKSLNAPRGNLADANTAEWANSVSKIKNELSELEAIIPGHGKIGGMELLDYTIGLFQQDTISSKASQ